MKTNYLAIEKTNFPIGQKYEGKVRDVYDVGNGELVIVTTDRISAFDRVLGTIPHKGQVLNEFSAFWFEQTRDIAPNHLIKVIDPNISVVKKTERISLEIVVRGYLTGSTDTSIWKRYENGERNFAGLILPNNLKKGERLQRPIVEFYTKAEVGGHDELVNPEGLEHDTKRLEEISLNLFDYAANFLENKDLVFIDTKYEFGLDEKGNVILIDEINTPDSSRIGMELENGEFFHLDKEHFRLEFSKRKGITESLRIGTAVRYAAAYEKITGRKLFFQSGDLIRRMEENLKKEGYLK